MDKGRRNLKFEVEDFVVVGVFSNSGAISFGKSGKLAPRCFGFLLCFGRISVWFSRVELPVWITGIR